MDILGYIIQINGESAAFAGGEFHTETARILRELADRIERGQVSRRVKLWDVNGNEAGYCDVIA